MPQTTSATRSRVRRTVVGLTGVALAVTGLSTAPAATAARAPKAPTGLTVKLPNTATPVLTWTRSAGATSYQVQVDNDGSFASPEISESTRNFRFVPTRNLSRGTQNWRVRAEKDGEYSSWSTGSFGVSPVGVPVGTSPADGAVLPQPDQPPLLRWQTSRGAVSYTVEVDGDADFIGAKSYTTRTTSYAIPEALPAGGYFWRVTASLDGGINSQPSPTMSFILGSLPSPKLTYPIDNINQAVEDVVFDWEPVSGAITYDLQVATDAGFNNFAYKADNIYGSRFSPPTTLYNDQFWWRVRAVDLAGQPTAWSTARFSFQRNWLDTPQAVWPLGSTSVPNANVPASNGDRFFYQWTPAQHASVYRLQVATDPNFSTSVQTCYTAGTTFVPRQAGDCSVSPGTVHYWRVRPEDAPYPGYLPGIFSAPQKVMWGNPTPAAGSYDGEFHTVVGLKSALTGIGAATGGAGCTAVSCSSMSATPVLTWARQPGIDTYTVVVANDENFTVSPMPTLNRYVTSNNYFALREGDDKWALAESEAGQPYYWYVIPCKNGVGCGPSPVSQNPPLPGAHSFQKISPAVIGLTSSDPAGSDITFSWQDYLDTNAASSVYGESGQQTAKTYRIQVDNEPSFAEPLLDQATVDQTTYTASDRLYPEGRIYWRVQAIDAGDNGLTWSAPAELVKSSPVVALQSPVGGAAVPGSTPLTWAPQPFAKYYEVEVYKNGDTAFSPANRVLGATVANPAYTPSEPLAASSSRYVWRVRRIDSRGNQGPWNAATFVSLGSAPELLSPGNGANQSFNGAYFEWSDVAGAASYQLSVRAGTNNQTFETVGTAYAPSELATGTYTWQVIARDSAGKTLGASAARSFWVDADPPRVLKVTPTKMTPKSTIKIRFTEPVKGASKKTVTLMKANKKGKFKVKVKAKVKVTKKGREVTIDPKGRLKRGVAYQVVFTTSKLRDAAGNTLGDATASVPGL